MWELQYLHDCTYPAAIYITNMGLFYLVVNVNCDGRLDAIVQMVASDKVASTFKYKIAVSNITGQKMFTHSSKVSIHKKMLFILLCVEPLLRNNCKVSEYTRAVSRQQLDKHFPNRNRCTCNNRGILGKGIFYSAHAKELQARQMG
jgi:hypothetical protein